MIALPPFWQLVALLATHWVGDFVLQTNFQASKKNKRLDALSLHVATYTATLFVAAVILFGLMPAITFAVVNAALHFVTDYITSRISRVSGMGDLLRRSIETTLSFQAYAGRNGIDQTIWCVRFRTMIILGSS
jgi:hypothetical protein